MTPRERRPARIEAVDVFLQHFDAAVGAEHVDGQAVAHGAGLGFGSFDNLDPEAGIDGVGLRDDEVDHLVVSGQGGGGVVVAEFPRRARTASRVSLLTPGLPESARDTENLDRSSCRERSSRVIRRVMKSPLRVAGGGAALANQGFLRKR